MRVLILAVSLLLACEASTEVAHAPWPTREHVDAEERCRRLCTSHCGPDLTPYTPLACVDACQADGGVPPHGC